MFCNDIIFTRGGRVNRLAAFHGCGSLERHVTPAGGVLVNVRDIEMQF